MTQAQTYYRTTGPVLPCRSFVFVRGGCGNVPRLHCCCELAFGPAKDAELFLYVKKVTDPGVDLLKHSGVRSEWQHHTRQLPPCANTNHRHGTTGPAVR
jgi:hypothetical protein